jgi:maltose O-acetyltransferase
VVNHDFTDTRSINLLTLFTDVPFQYDKICNSTKYFQVFYSPIRERFKMKNRLVYLSLRILTIITRNKFARLDDHLKKFGYLANIDKYTKQGATIGKKSILINCTLSNSTKGDQFFIGENCTLTGTTLLAHDASPSIFITELVIKEHPYLSASRLSYRAPIRIGNNVFIGWGSIVLPGITVGDNVVIGAGSVVTKDIPADSVAAGNPAKVIKATHEYIADYRAKLLEFPEQF